MVGHFEMVGRDRSSGGNVPKSIQRSLLFFTTQLRHKEGGELLHDQAALWKRLHRLPYERRRRPAGRNAFEVVEVFSAPPNGYFAEGRIYRDKNDDHPLIGRGEVERPLDLREDEGLRFATHFGWWNLQYKAELFGQPAHVEGVLVAEFNKDGPRVSALETYTAEKFPDWVLQIRPMAHFDPFEVLKRHKYRVKSLQIRVPVKAAGRRLRGIIGMWAPSAADGVSEVRIEVKAARRQHIDLKDREGDLRQEVGQMLAADEGTVIVGLDGNEAMDLLTASLRIKAKTVQLNDGSRTVRPQSILAEIRHAVEEHADDLGQALGRTWGEHEPTGD